MALNKQLVSLDFTGGIDQKTDDFTVIPSKLSSLNNGRFTNKSSIEPRGGFVPAISPVVSGVDIGAVWSGDMPSLGTRLSKTADTLGLENANGFHAADLASNKWRQVATSFNRCNAELTGIMHDTGNVLEFDIAVYGDIQVIVYSTNKNGVSGAGLVKPTIWLKVLNKGVVVRHERIDSATQACASPKVVLKLGTFCIYYLQQDTGAATRFIKVGLLLPSDLTGSLGIATYASDVYQGGVLTGKLDAIYNPYTSHVYLVYASGGAGPSTVTAARCPTTDPTTSDNTRVSAALPNPCAAVRAGVTSLVAARVGYIVFATTTTPADGLRTCAADLDGGSGALVLGAIAATTPSGKICQMTDPNNTTNIWVSWEEGTQGSSSTRVLGANYQYTAFNAAPVTTKGFAATTLRRSVGICADMFVRNRSVYLPAYHYSKIQATFFATEIGKTATAGGTVVGPTSTPDTCAKITANGAFLYNSTFGGTIDSNVLSTHSASKAYTTGAKVFIPIQRGNGTRRVEQGLDLSDVGLDLLTLDFSAQLNSEVVNKSAVLAGANPCLFDNTELAELGFNLYPDDDDITLGLGGAAGVLADGTYQATCIYVYVDSNGNKFRSRAAPPKSYTIAGGGGLASLFMTVPTLRLTCKTKVLIELYITEPNGTLFYPVLRAPLAGVLTVGGLLNDPTIDTMTTGDFSFATSGANALNASTLLYTTGGVLSAGPYPSCKHVALHQDRLFFSGCEDPTFVQYTEEKTSIGVFPSTNEVYILQCSNEVGRVSATTSMDDKLIVGQETQIGVVFGRGPNSLGLDNSFSNVTKVVRGHGLSWDNSNAIVSDQDGVWFYDQRGLRHINRGLSLTETLDSAGRPIKAGSEIDSLVSATVPTGAVFLDLEKQIRFQASGGTGAIFVYDCDSKQWSFYSTGAELYTLSGEAQVLDGVYYFISSTNGLLVREDYSVPYDLDLDAGQTLIDVTLFTAWIKPSVVQGYERVYKVLLIGSPITANSDNMSISIYEYTNYNSTNVVHAVSATFQANNYNNAPIQYEYKPAIQKCEAIKLQIVVIGSFGMRITNLALELGVKKGAFKLPTAQRI